MMSMTACAKGISRVHIPLVTYSVEVQKKAAEELSSQGPACASDAITPECSASKRIITDCKVLRDRVKINNDQ